MTTVNNDWLIRDLCQEFGLNTAPWTLYFRAEVDAYSLHAFRNFLDLYLSEAERDVKPTIVFTCKGGFILEALAFIDLMKHYKKQYGLEVDVEIHGYGMSAVVPILVSATGKRRMCSSSVLMLHSMKNLFNDAMSTSNLERQMANGRKMEALYLEIMNKSTKLPKKELDDSMAFDLYFTAQEALDFEMIDEII